MNKTPLAVTIGLVSFLMIVGVGKVDGLEPEWLVGRWSGQAGGHNVRPALLVVEVKNDGSFEGEAHTQYEGIVPFRDGKWSIVGDTAAFEYQAGRGRNTRTVKWTLTRNGESLEGSGLIVTTSSQYPIRLEKTK